MIATSATDAGGAGRPGARRDSTTTPSRSRKMAAFGTVLDALLQSIPVGTVPYPCVSLAPRGFGADVVKAVGGDPRAEPAARDLALQDFAEIEGVANVVAYE